MPKLILDDFDLEPIYLIGIYTNMESFRLAFYLNRELGIQLKRSENDMMLYGKDGETTNFPFFLFHNEKEDILFTLIENKASVERKSKDDEQVDLFTSLPSLDIEEKYLIPEEETVDYFFKIETELLESYDFDHLISLIKKIPQIITVRSIDYEGLKNKNNLIF